MKKLKRYSLLFSIAFCMTGMAFFSASAGHVPNNSKCEYPKVYNMIREVDANDTLPNGKYFMRLKNNKPVEFTINEK